MCIFPSSVHVVNIEAESKPFIGIYGKIGFEPFFSVAAASLFIVSQVDERGFGIGIGYVLRLQDSVVVWVEKEKLAGVFPVEVHMCDTWGTQVSQIGIMPVRASCIVCVLKAML